jgi:hypothetical protein
VLSDDSEELEMSPTLKIDAVADGGSELVDHTSVEKGKERRRIKTNLELPPSSR